MCTLQTMYSDLMNLSTLSDAFYFSDYTSYGGGKYRIFTYRLAEYNDFLHPNATESRGIMYELDSNDEPIRIAARPMCKFFNAYENPTVMFPRSLTRDSIVVAMDKLDGSVIASYKDTDGVIRTKSNSSLHSEHAQNSTAMIHADPELLKAITEADADGWTVNMEYTSPRYRIVLPYQNDNLTVLNLRNRESGSLMYGTEMKERYPVLFDRSIFISGIINEDLPAGKFLHEVIDGIRKLEYIEGFVLVLDTGQTCKVKTDWYCERHFSRDSIVVPSRLYKVVLNDASDDLKQMVSTDPYAIKMIEKMEHDVFMCYNKLVSDVETFCAENKHLDRKSFAEAVKTGLSPELNRQGLAFVLYGGGEPKYKEEMLKQRKNVLNGF